MPDANNVADAQVEEVFVQAEEVLVQAEGGADAPARDKKAKKAWDNSYPLRSSDYWLLVQPTLVYCLLYCWVCFYVRSYLSGVVVVGVVVGFDSVMNIISIRTYQGATTCGGIGSHTWVPPPRLNWVNLMGGWKSALFKRRQSWLKGVREDAENAFHNMLVAIQVICFLLNLSLVYLILMSISKETYAAFGCRVHASVTSYSLINGAAIDWLCRKPQVAGGAATWFGWTR